MRSMWLVPRSLSSFAALRRLRMTGGAFVLELSE
jgi:hypothetical protein